MNTFNTSFYFCQFVISFRCQTVNAECKFFFPSVEFALLFAGVDPFYLFFVERPNQSFF